MAIVALIELAVFFLPPVVPCVPVPLRRKTGAAAAVWGLLRPPPTLYGLCGPDRRRGVRNAGRATRTLEGAPGTAAHPLSLLRMCHRLS
jgi:hypothetical protein